MWYDTSTLANYLLRLCFHRAVAPPLAISDLRRFDKPAARALPPRFPPFCPLLAASGFACSPAGDGLGAWPVAAIIVR